MKPYVLGIDIGGTNTVFGIVDTRGTVIASNSIKTQKHSDINDYIDELYTEITRLIQLNDAVDKIHGIGIGAPNANYFTGTIEDGVNLIWPTPIPLAQLVRDKFGIPVAVTNDANAAAIGAFSITTEMNLFEWNHIPCFHYRFPSTERTSLQLYFHDKTTLSSRVCHQLLALFRWVQISEHMLH